MLYNVIFKKSGFIKYSIYVLKWLKNELDILECVKFIKII